MNDTARDHTAARIRDLLDPTGDPGYERAEERSRVRNGVRLRGHAADAGHVRRARRMLAVAVLAAAAVTVAVALSPGGGGRGRSDAEGGGAATGLVASADAAEALAWAGDVLVDGDAGSAVGTGPVWHGVTRTHHDGKLVSVNEQWFDSASDRNLLLAWGRDRSGGAREVLLVDRVDADGAQRLRRFELPEGEGAEWAFPTAGLDPTNALDLPAGAADRQGQLAIAMRAWLGAVSGGADAAELRAATQAFMRATPDYFSAQPEFSMPPGGGVIETSDAETREFERARAAVPVRQVLYLLTTVQATPQATAVLYDLMGGFDQLERLPDAQVDGRAVLRIRFDGSDDDVSPARERVLVIDGETGRIVRTETLDGKSWTQVAPARRVTDIGDDHMLCTDGNSVPCALLDGRGPAEDQADEFVANMRVRYAAHALNRRNARELGDAAPTPLCTDMSPAGKCLPASAAEASRLRAIAADQAALEATATFDNATAALGDDTAFSTNVVLDRTPDTDGVVRGQGQCLRDWRVLSICRG